ncbi:MAG: 2-C-methyl-D-erythritol 4-phosphate cytidylyltransferase, partial [Clostridia bacterium]|nr:2-C-methyl-D-erythritol 4-phosphate cytidylyltransferase [Clostridia bacterium]
AHRTKAAIAGCPASDTVKIVSDKIIKETPDRKNVWLAQTPQVFQADLFRGCLYQCIKQGKELTDDASVVESFGVPVRMVDCGSTNIKITYYSDIEIARSILKGREDLLS